MNHKDIDVLLKEASVWRVKMHSPAGSTSSEYFDTLKEAQAYIRDMAEEWLKVCPAMMPRFELDYFG